MGTRANEPIEHPLAAEFSSEANCDTQSPLCASTHLSTPYPAAIATAQSRCGAPGACTRGPLLNPLWPCAWRAGLPIGGSHRVLYACEPLAQAMEGAPCRSRHRRRCPACRPTRDEPLARAGGRCQPGHHHPAEADQQARAGDDVFERPAAGSSCGPRPTPAASHPRLSLSPPAPCRKEELKDSLPRGTEPMPRRHGAAAAAAATDAFPTHPRRPHLTTALRLPPCPRRPAASCTSATAWPSRLCARWGRVSRSRLGTAL